MRCWDWIAGILYHCAFGLFNCKQYSYFVAVEQEAVNKALSLFQQQHQQQQQQRGLTFETVESIVRTGCALTNQRVGECENRLGEQVGAAIAGIV